MRKILLFITLSTPMLLLAAPNNPADLQLSALSTHNVSIRWKDMSSDESGFKIYRDGKLVTITPPNTEIYYDDNLKANTTYRYTVKATDDIPDIKDNELDISMEKLPHGTKLSSIKNGKKELLNDTNSELFSLTIQNIKTKEIKTVVPSHGWNSVKFGLFDKHIRTITLSQPTDDTLPSTLRVLILIDQFKGASAWDLKVTGVGKNHSLLDGTFPNITIKATNNSHFFLPLLFGQVLDNPQTNVDKVLTYPKGSDYSLSGASMQFLSYYDKDNQGIYFGFHDPKASLKKFHISSKNSGVNLQGSTPIPDKTLAENDWDFSGIFELDLYDGDWYEASQIYKHWVFNYSNYKIVDSPKRLARAKEIGKISLWSAERLWQKNKNLGNDLVEGEFTDFKNFLKDDQTDVTLGVHFTAWSGEDFDKNIPDVFLNAKENLSGLVSNLKQKFGDKMMIDLYTNAYIYDTKLSTYPTHEPATAKGEDGKIPYQEWGVDDDTNKSRIFAIMCPTQKIWQDKNVAVHRFIETLGIDGVYLDQVTAASPIACTDKNHGHSIGGGDFWRSGYAKMIDSIYKVHQDKTYLFSETVTDSLIDSFDGFMTMYHTLQNQVPAIQSIYGGKVQFFGPAIGTNNYAEDANKPDSENLYALAAQGFAFGEILGPIYPSISQHYVDGAADRARKDRAATYIKKLAFMREKLKRFISFGSMQKPLTLTGNIPTITVPATKHGAIKLLAIQNGIWKKDSSIVVVFINGNRPDLNAADINFNFAFDGSKYGLHNGFSIQEITPTSQRDLGVVENSFTKNVSLKSADMKAYILREN